MSDEFDYYDWEMSDSWPDRRQSFRKGLEKPSKMQKLLDHIKECNSYKDSYAVLRKGLYSGGDWWAIYACEYVPEYGARSSYSHSSRHLTFEEAMVVYITYGKRELSSDMQREMKEHKKFVLDHYTAEELEEHANLLRRTRRKEAKSQLLKEKEALNKKLDEINQEFDKLNEKLKELDK